MLGRRRKDLRLPVGGRGLGSGQRTLGIGQIGQMGLIGRIGRPLPQYFTTLILRYSACRAPGTGIAVYASPWLRTSS